MIRNLLSRLIERRRRPIVVSTFRVKKTDAERELKKKTAQLAREMGKPNPLRGA